MYVLLSLTLSDPSSGEPDADIGQINRDAALVGVQENKGDGS